MKIRFALIAMTLVSMSTAFAEERQPLLNCSQPKSESEKRVCDKSDDFDCLQTAKKVVYHLGKSLGFNLIDLSVNARETEKLYSVEFKIENDPVGLTHRQLVRVAGYPRQCKAMSVYGDGGRR